MLRPAADFKDKLAKFDLDIDTLVRLVGEDNINRSTVFAWLSPKADRPRNIRRRKAWRVARAYAQHAGVSEDEAFRALFVEVPDEHPVTT